MTLEVTQGRLELRQSRYINERDKIDVAYAALYHSNTAGQ